MSIFTYIGSKLRSAAAFFRDDFFDESEIAGHREFINEAAGMSKKGSGEGIWTGSFHQRIRLSELEGSLAKAKHQKKKHSHIKAEIDELRAKMGMESA